jgi:hypothetical protein
LYGRPEGYYGGCRVDLGQVWSQLVSLGGSQLFRGVYLLGEGPMAEIDPQAFADRKQSAEQLRPGYGRR